MCNDRCSFHGPNFNIYIDCNSYLTRITTKRIQYVSSNSISQYRIMDLTAAVAVSGRQSFYFVFNAHLFYDQQ